MPKRMFIHISNIYTYLTFFRYIEILKRHLVPFLETFGQQKPLFQQDNAAPHCARATKEFFTEQNIEVMDFPSLSPDLNPIENLWAELSRHIYGCNRTFLNRNDVVRAVQDAIIFFNKYKKKFIKSLTGSIEDRCINVLIRNGAHLL